MTDMSRVIFVTGFARGGTSWLRNCVGSHPDIAKMPGELVLFHGNFQRPEVERQISEVIEQAKLDGRFFVTKAPANAPDVDRACKAFPESKFLFIIRDPRDVFISHKRGNKQWMRGRNSTVDGCLEKIQSYYEGYERARALPNIMLVRYEDLHQSFHATMKRVYEFIGVNAEPMLLWGVWDRNNFVSQTGRKYMEDRDAARRKGVVGDWVNFMEPKELDWLKASRFWSGFMKQYDYEWTPLTFESILGAMKQGGVKDMSEEDLFHSRIDPGAVNTILVHDIDLLASRQAREGVLETARIEGRLGLSGLYNFLPLDDTRYRKIKPADVIGIINEVKRLNSKAIIGLHLNAAERFFPADAPDYGDDHPDVAKAVEYLRQQVNDYAKLGIRFRIATGHGYGRGRKKPNNYNTPIFSEELARLGIHLYDTIIRTNIKKQTRCWSNFTDVGESLSVRFFPHPGRIDDPKTYQQLPRGMYLRFLSHPGNYSVHRPMTLGHRLHRNTLQPAGAGADED